MVHHANHVNYVTKNKNRIKIYNTIYADDIVLQLRYSSEFL